MVQQSSTRQSTVTELTKGLAYRFKVLTFNFNQQVPTESASSLHYTCVRPKDLQAPLFVSTTSTEITLEWSDPSDNGGCPITGYYLMVDDGITGVPSIELTQLADRSVPTLKRLTVPLSTLGLKYTFQLWVENREGATSSETVSYLFAAVPATPSSPPQVRDYTSTECTVVYLFTDSVSGADILQYELSMKDSLTN